MRSTGTARGRPADGPRAHVAAMPNGCSRFAPQICEGNAIGLRNACGLRGRPADGPRTARGRPEHAGLQGARFIYCHSAQKS